MPPSYALPLVPATSRSLVQLSTVKAKLGIPDADTSQDDVLQGLIDAASSEIAFGVDGLQREPWRQTYAERTWSDGSAFLVPVNWPIESIASIIVGDPASAPIDAAVYEVAGNRRDRIWRRDLWPASSIAGGLPALDYGLQYTAGWVMPGDAMPPAAPDAARLPRELELAALVAVTEWRAQGALAPAGIQSEAVAGLSITYATGADAAAGRFTLPAGAARLVAGWR